MLCSIRKKKRISWISGLKEGKLLAPLTFEGSCNRDLFGTWLQNCLLPELEPGDIIIIDNASIKGNISKKLSCGMGNLVSASIFDLNKIENWWGV